MDELNFKERKSSLEKKKDHILMGLGNIWRGDDGVGCFIAQNFQSNDWLVLDCGTTPENFTSLIRKAQPKYLVMIDAAEMNLEPGEFRMIPPEKIDKFYLSTHNIPLSLLISYLDKWAEKIILIGIQPEKIEDSQRISKKLQDSVRKIMQILKKKEMRELERVNYKKLK